MGTTFFVSNEASNGFVVGSDSNSGLNNFTPFLSIAAAVSAAANGDRVVVNGALYALGGTLLDINKNIEIVPFTPLGTIITGNHATAVLSLSAQNNSNSLLFGPFRVEPVGGVASASSRGVSISLYSGFDATVIIDGARVLSAANSAVNDLSVRGTTIMRNMILAGQIGAQAMLQAINVGTTAPKIIKVTGCKSDGQLSATASNTPPINISRTVPGSFEVKVFVENNTIDVDYPTSLGTSCTGRGIGVANCKGAIIRNNDVKVTTLGATASDASGISVTASSTVSIADECVVEDNKVVMNGPACRTIQIGDGTVNDPGVWVTATAYTVGTFRRPITANGLRYEVTAIAGTGTTGGAEPTWPIMPGATVIDNAGANQITWTCRAYQTAANCVVRRNKSYVLYYNGSATGHGISFSNVQGGQCYSNYVEGGAVGIICSLGGSQVVRGNVVRGAYYAPLFAKGAGINGVPTLFSNNTVICDDSIYGARFGNYAAIGCAVQGSTNTVGAVFENNLIKVVNGAGWKNVVVDASQVATFSNNNYHADPVLQTAWSYQGTTYATLALWQAARETVAYALDPGAKFVTDYLVTNPDLAEKGKPQPGAATVPGYEGVHFLSPPTIGAVEFARGRRIPVMRAA
jgi:hypothetical protein